MGGVTCDGAVQRLIMSGLKAKTNKCDGDDQAKPENNFFSYPTPCHFVTIFEYDKLTGKFQVNIVNFVSDGRENSDVTSVTPILKVQ